MPKSKQNQKRKLKLRKRNQKFETLIQKRVAAFNALPEEDQIALLTRWKNEQREQLEQDKIDATDNE